MTDLAPVVRPARAADSTAAVPLIHSSGPAAFRFVFDVPPIATAEDFLHRAFVDGRGEFGYRNHVVAELDGTVVGIGAAWGRESNARFARVAARQIFACFGWMRGAGVLTRGLRLETVLRPPTRGEWYVAHLGVHPQLRSRGVGAALVQHLLAAGRAGGYATAALDVATTNPRAEALYARLGFRVVRERSTRLGNAQGVVPGHRRMAMDLVVGSSRAQRGRPRCCLW